MTINNFKWKLQLEPPFNGLFNTICFYVDSLPVYGWLQQRSTQHNTFWTWWNIKNKWRNLHNVFFNGPKILWWSSYIEKRVILWHVSRLIEIIRETFCSRKYQNVCRLNLCLPQTAVYLCNLRSREMSRRNTHHGSDVF